MESPLLTDTSRSIVNAGCKRTQNSASLPLPRRWRHVGKLLQHPLSRSITVRVHITLCIEGRNTEAENLQIERSYASVLKGDAQWFCAPACIASLKVRPSKIYQITLQTTNVHTSLYCCAELKCCFGLFGSTKRLQHAIDSYVTAGVNTRHHAYRRRASGSTSCGRSKLAVLVLIHRRAIQTGYISHYQQCLLHTLP